MSARSRPVLYQLISPFSMLYLSLFQSHRRDIASACLIAAELHFCRDLRFNVMQWLLGNDTKTSTKAPPATNTQTRISASASTESVVGLMYVIHGAVDNTDFCGQTSQFFILYVEFEFHKKQAVREAATICPAHLRRRLGFNCRQNFACTRLVYYR